MSADATPAERRKVALAVLRKRADFLAAARGRRAGMPTLMLQARSRDRQDCAPELVRVGFTCSKKVGNAVARNRAKRRLREAARDVLSERGKPGWDYVLIGRHGLTADRPFPLLRQDLRDALDRVHRAPPRASEACRRPAASTDAS